MCIEHAIGLMEEERLSEALSKGVSSMSLIEANNKVGLINIFVPYVSSFKSRFTLPYFCFH